MPYEERVMLAPASPGRETVNEAVQVSPFLSKYESPPTGVVVAQVPEHPVWPGMCAHGVEVLVPLLASLPPLDEM